MPSLQGDEGAITGFYGEKKRERKIIEKPMFFSDAKNEEQSVYIDKLEKNIKEKDEIIAHIKEKANGLNVENEKLQNTIQELNNQLDESQNQIEELHEIVTKFTQQKVEKVPDIDVDTCNKRIFELEKLLEQQKNIDRVMRFKAGQMFLANLDKPLRKMPEISEEENAFKNDDFNPEDDNVLVRLFRKLEENPPTLYQRLQNADSRNTGILTLSELTTVFEAIKISPQDMISMTKFVNAFGKGSSSIKINEFMNHLNERATLREDWERQLMTRIVSYFRELNMTITNAFAFFDSDESGCISIEEMETALKTMKIIVPRRDLKALFSIMDKDNNGKISLDEFSEKLLESGGEFLNNEEVEDQKEFEPDNNEDVQQNIEQKDAINTEEEGANLETVKMQASEIPEKEVAVEEKKQSVNPTEKKEIVQEKKQIVNPTEKKEDEAITEQIISPEKDKNKQQKPKKKNLYSWGLGSHGVLGNKSEQKEITPFLVTLEKTAGEPVALSTGGFLSVCLTSLGYVYTFGSNVYHRGGHADIENSIKIPKRIPNIPKIAKIAAGDWHMIAISEAGECYAVGNNKSGALGTGNSMDCPSFTLIPNLNDIVFISAGHGYSMFIDRNNKLYSTGLGLMTGNPGKENQLIPTIVSPLSEESIISVSCGYVHCAAVSKEGKLYTWGSSAYYQLGHGNSRPQKKPKLVEALKDIIVIQASCTRTDKYCHTGCLDINGEVYTWGSGCKGKLGHAATWSHEDPADELLPKKIEALKGIKIKEIICPGLHSAVLSEDGKLYTFGCGSDGRLGHPEYQGHKYLYKEPLPRIVDKFSGMTVEVVTSSYYHMLAIAS